MGDASGHTNGVDHLPRSRLRRTVALLLVRWADATTRWVTRLLGESASAGRAHLSEAELRELVAHNTVLDRDERQLIHHVLTAGDRQVRALMVPRTEVTFLDAASGVEEAAKLAMSTRHSRFPVMDTNRDDVIGFVHLRDLLVRPDGPAPATVTELVRPLHRIPASKRALVALSEMRRGGAQVALVVDEYGGTAGIVTLEDLLEELVGEIHDEYDAAPEAVEGGAPAEVEGLLNLPDFAERAGFALPPGPYDTVGGFIMAALGRLPVRGDEVRVASWRLTVSDMDGRRVARVALAPVPAPAPPSAQVELLPGLAVG